MLKCLTFYKIDKMIDCLINHTDNRPTMAKLFYMDYQNEKNEEVEVRIIYQVKANWRGLVHALELPEVTVANEEARPGWTPESACSSVFTAWLTGGGANPHTWTTVLKALKKLGGYKQFIKQVELALDAEHNR